MDYSIPVDIPDSYHYMGLTAYDINGLFPFGVNMISGSNYDKKVTFGLSNPTNTKVEFNNPYDCIEICVLFTRQEFIRYIEYSG